MLYRDRLNYVLTSDNNQRGRDWHCSRLQPYKATVLSSIKLTCSENFFRLNREAVETGRNRWLNTLRQYRTHYRTEALRKHQTLSYSFHINIYCRPQMRYVDLGNALKRDDINPDVLEIPETAGSGMIYLFERILVVNQSNVHRWWYVT